jgi:type I restriction enzyme, S subunit
MARISDEFILCERSDVKSTDGKDKGAYPFYTSSSVQKKFVDFYQYDFDAVVIGMGGSASCLFASGKFSVSMHNVVLKSKGNVLPKFLAYFLNKDSCFVLQDKFHGTGIKFLKPRDLMDIEFSYPDIETQKKIISELDDTQEYIKGTKTKISLCDELIKSRFNEMFGSRFETQPLHKLSTIATPLIGLTYHPENVSPSGTIVLRSGNIQNGELDLKEDVVRVSGLKIGESKMVKNLDILMCARNGSARLVGKTCLIKDPQEQMAFGAFMAVVRSPFPYFMNSFFNSDFFKNQLTNTGTTSVNQITNGMLNNYLLIVPTKDDEKNFSAFAQQIDKLKINLRSEVSLAEELFTAKMNRYF